MLTGLSVNREVNFSNKPLPSPITSFRIQLLFVPLRELSVKRAEPNGMQLHPE
jgi:hypothetical protein